MTDKFGLTNVLKYNWKVTIYNILVLWKTNGKSDLYNILCWTFSNTEKYVIV